MTILLTGAAGQLGAAMSRRLARSHDVVALTRHELDLTDHRASRARVHQIRPDVVLNCAAYNDVDGAQDDAVTALAVNAFGVRTLGRAASDVGAIFVHYGSDFVFDGRGARPYREEDPPNPQSVYATSKLLGEWFAQDVERHYVLRVESLFGGGAVSGAEPPATRPRGSSLDRLVDQIMAGKEVRAFVDRTVSPSYVEDVVDATARLLGAQAPPGLYHCVNSGRATWFEVAAEAARVLGRDASLVPVRMADLQLRARRPQSCALSNAKLASVGVVMPTWQDAVARYVELRRAANVNGSTPVS